MGRWKELKGNQYGHLYVLEDFHDKGNLHYCKCICDCENHTIKNVRACHLLSGAIDNCGCVTKERMKKSSTHHGMKFTRFYMIWQTFRRRCEDKNFMGYNNYGGRGITYQESWKKFENFRDDMYESYLKHCEEYGEKDTTLDRIDVNGNYCKENCRWTTRKIQANNTRKNHYITINGEVKTLTQWVEFYGIALSTVKNYIRKGYSDIDAINMSRKVRRN